MDDILALLDHIDPSALNYQEWVNVGMALKHEGADVSVWDAWSRLDASRYHAGECEKKWRTFNGSATPVTGGTLYEYARRQGWSPAAGGYALDWDSEITSDLTVIDQRWIAGEELREPEIWEPHRELIRYLEALFDPSENVGYVTESWQNEDGKYLPSKGCSDRTAGELIEALSKCGGDIGAVLGDYKPECGAWIRFNPLDGKGVKDENVTDYRYALVESDGIDIARQNAIIRELELPVAVLVHSGRKSLHAIVKIDAEEYRSYRRCVDYLYDVCAKNGLNPDQSNRNPSRLSRMPGVLRDGHKQYIIDTNIGKANFREWKEYIETLSDDLPNPESMADAWDNMPELAPCLIDGVLRQGHKMLLAGPSKAGKSYALIELCAAIAEGREWMGFGCAKGRVLYVNLELDRASCLHRFRDVYTALGWEPKNVGSIDVWNLRGRSVPMDKLAPKLIRRAAKKDYIAVIIDPIYKVITGDENAADQMAMFCNQFDRICTELRCAVIYCHHHSKGAQGQKKSMDRASGSGVFARDPDALLDMIELEVGEDARRELHAADMKRIFDDHLRSCGVLGKVVPADCIDLEQLSRICADELSDIEYIDLQGEIAAAERASRTRTAWRVEGTLREFARFEPVDLWFDYPVHRVDTAHTIRDSGAAPSGSWQNASRVYAEGKGERDKAKNEALDMAYEACSIDGDVTVAALAEYMGVDEKTVRRRVKQHGEYQISNGIVRTISRNCP